MVESGPTQPCWDHPWRYIHRPEGQLDVRWCPMCGYEEYTEDGDRWTT